MIYLVLGLTLQPPSIVIVTGNPRILDYREVVAEDSCLPHVFEFRWKNSYQVGGGSEVSRVVIDSAEVPGAAAELQARAANRSIEYIGLVNCGEEDQPVGLQAYMELSPTVSAARGMEPRVIFRLKRIDGRWRIEF